jgi:small-conductance mechanosensitive channel
VTTTTVLASLALAVLALIGATLLLWPLRRARSWRPALLSLWLAVPALWLALVLTWAEGWPRTAVSPDVVKLVQAAAVLLGVIAALQLMELWVWDALLERRQQRKISRFLVNLFNLVVFVVAVLAVAAGIYHANITGLLVTSTVITIIIGLALQDLLRSVFAGLALQVESPFQVGDWVRLGEHEGQVIEMNWRTLTLRTTANNLIVLPNHQVANEYLINYSRPSPLQALDVRVGVAETHPPGPVKQVLIAAAATAPGVSTDPAPFAYVEDYGDSAIGYRLRFWITDYGAAPRIRDGVMTTVWYRLRRDGIAMPVLSRAVTVQSVAEDQAAVARAGEQRAVVALLRPLVLLAPLSDAQIEHLATRASRQLYTRGEPLVRQGEPGDSLYVIQTGRVRVEVQDQHGRAVALATRGPQEYFGEMSLLTGAPRSATVSAETETEVIVVGREAVAEVLLADPAIAEQLSETLAARLEETRRQLAAAAPADAAPTGRGDILRRIRALFGLAP